MNLTHLIVTIIVYLVVDLPWVAFGAKALNVDWNSAVEIIQKSPIKIKKIPALISYIIIAVCIYYFGVRDRLNNNLSEQFIDSVMIALAIYGSFDLINYAIFSETPLLIVLSDIVWGIISVSLTVIITSKIINSLNYSVKLDTIN